MEYHIAKGVFDILPKDPDPQGAWRESYLWQYLEAQIRQITYEYGFREIRTPLFEMTELFTRSIGDTSDIVKKEMYTFLDKADRSLTLRPEGTAPVMRAFIEKNLEAQAPIHKFFYIFPMFRYERQQAGRYRQHHQFGVEVIGSSSPYQDAEVVHLLWTFYSRLGLQNLTLQINSIGDVEARKSYRHSLKEFLKPHVHELSKDSQDRYQHNPFRILDSKDENDQKILKEAPKITDFLSEASRSHFETFMSLLKTLSVPYQVNPKLVRGLDYYNNTVFEILSHELGAQNSLGGGGRYDGLIKELGGSDLPAFGFGAGLERIIQTMLAQQVSLPPRPSPLLFIIPLGEEASQFSFVLASKLRNSHIPVEIDLSGKKLKNAMRLADLSSAKYSVVIGENELKTKMVELKEMATSTSEKISLEHLEKKLTDEIKKDSRLQRP